MRNTFKTNSSTNYEIILFCMVGAMSFWCYLQLRINRFSSPDTALDYCTTVNSWSHFHASLNLWFYVDFTVQVCTWLADAQIIFWWLLPKMCLSLCLINQHPSLYHENLGLQACARTGFKELNLSSWLPKSHCQIVLYQSWRTIWKGQRNDNRRWALVCCHSTSVFYSVPMKLFDALKSARLHMMR